jgi:hypothetical protein
VDEYGHFALLSFQVPNVQITFGNDAASLMLRSDELDVFEQALLEPAVDVGELFPDFLQRRQGGAHCFGSFGWPVGQIRHLLAKWHNLGILQGSINDKELTFCAASRSAVDTSSATSSTIAGSSTGVAHVLLLVMGFGKRDFCRLSIRGGGFWGGSCPAREATFLRNDLVCWDLWS